MGRPTTAGAPGLAHDNTGRIVPVDRALQRTRAADHYRNSTHHKHHQRHLKHLSVWAVGLLLQGPALAQVNATAAPSSVSNGSVTNQAIQVAGPPGFTYHMGPNQISCQGPSLALSPFLTGSHSFALPRRQYQRTPYYNPVDADENGAPDYPGEIMFWSKAPTGQKDSYNINAGLALTATIPLDGGLHERCKALAEAQLQLYKQKLAHAVLDYQIGRLKHCSALAAQGYIFKPGTPAAQVCADVQIVPKPGQVLPHKHPISDPEHDAKPSGPGSDLFVPGVVQRHSKGEVFALAGP